MQHTLRFDVFGRVIVAEQRAGGWRLFQLGPEGKRMPVADVAIPAFIAPSEIDQYLADIYHEWASDKHPSVKRLSD